MKSNSVDENKLKQLLSIDHKQNTPEERVLMIVQGVNWLTLLQDVFSLFFYKVPLALFSMAKTCTHQKENK